MIERILWYLAAAAIIAVVLTDAEGFIKWLGF